MLRSSAFSPAFLATLLLIAAASPSYAQPSPPALGVTPPRVQRHVDAVYPANAPAAQDAQVDLALTVDAAGQVTDVAVLVSGGALFDEAAVRAARQWAFTPALQGGSPVPSRIRVPFHFAPPPPSTNTPPAAAAVTRPSPASTAASQEVTVLGRATPPSRGASDFHIRVGALAMVPRKNASDFLKLAPGILLTNDGGEGHGEQVFLRGFDAREGQDIEFTVGGVPINESGNLHGNGYADTHFILPELVRSLRVLEGPFDPRQGNYAVAGSADYQLGLDRRGLTAKAMAGSFGTQRLVLTWGPKDHSEGTFAGAEVYKTDGFGQNRDAERATAMGQYEGRFGEQSSFRVGGTGYSTTYHSAGVLREDDYQAGRTGFFDTYDPNQGGDSSRYSFYGDIETHEGDTTFSNQLFFVDRSMRLRENFTGFLLDVQTPLQRPHEQRGDLLDLNHRGTTLGARGYANVKGEALGQTQQLEFGYYARGDRTASSQQRLEAAQGNPYKTETNVEAQLGDIGLYMDANVRVLRWLSFRGGVRADLFTFTANNLCAVQDVSRPSNDNPPGDASCLSQQAFGRYREPNQRASTSSTAVLPRGSVLVGPFSHVTFSASYGEGVRSVDPSYITQDVRTPFARIRAYEGGATYARTLGAVDLVARSIFFQTLVDRDLIFNQTAGRNVLANGTTRTGWVGSLRTTGRFFDQSANVTLVKSTFDDTHLLVPYVPDAVVRSDSALFSELPFAWQGTRFKGALGAGVTYVGRRALPYGERSQEIFTVDLSSTLSWRAYELGLIATNLLDARYRLGQYNYASDFQSRPTPTLVPMGHFSAGAPRALYVTFAVSIGGAGG